MASWMVVLVWGCVLMGVTNVVGGKAKKDPCPGGMTTVMYNMASCLPAAKDDTVTPDTTCCAKIVDMSANPACLCACVTSPMATFIGVKPSVALSIPKRCNIESRPVGYRCAGGYVP